MPKPLIIAIDGPAGAGKSTVAQKLAERLGLAYVDSGATYRAAALKVLDLGVLPDDVRAVAGVVANADIRIATDGSRSRVFLDGADVSEQIRSAEVTVAAAQVSRLSSVREKLIALQRTLASGRGVVMEGRDIGTVVFPDAPRSGPGRARPPQARAGNARGSRRNFGTDSLRDPAARSARRRAKNFSPGRCARRRQDRLDAPHGRPSR